ncbi:MAG: DNA-directed DNA polymerase III PolC [Kiritimatiellia bacterium]|jgi:DNA-directed DNA polymerase III PolC
MNLIHVDADAFFASVEQASDTHLRGRPMAVGGEKRGIIASASYEARKFGIYTPMPTARARRLCPQLIVVPGDYEKYERFSRWMFSYIYDFTPMVEVCSIDEGYFDLTGCRENPREVAETVRRAIFQSLKITVSEGLASNKLVSQIASKLRKPASFIEVLPGQERSFLRPLPNRCLPGIGPATAQRMNAAGLARIGQIAETDVDSLALLVGNRAPQLRRFAFGEDSRPVVPEQPAAKSYSHQRTFDADVTDEAYIEAVLRGMADQLMSSVRGDRKMIRTLTVKVRYNDFAEDQCSRSLSEPTDLEIELYGHLHSMLRQAWKRRVSLRLVSLKVSNVYDALFQIDLPLDGPTRSNDARRRLALTVDALREKRGRYVIMRGHDLVLERGKKYPAKAGDAEPKQEAAPTDVESQPRDTSAVRRGTRPSVPLHTHSYYSLMDSVLSPQAIVDFAVAHELPAVGLTDTGNLHGAVPFFQAATKAGVKPLIGTELKVDGKTLLVYVQNTQGYQNLCRILNAGRSFSVCDAVKPYVSNPSGLSLSPKDSGRTSPALFDFDTSGLLAIGADYRLELLFPEAFYLGVSCPKAAKTLRNPTRLPVLAAPGVHYLHPADRKKYDIVQSIRTLTLLEQPHLEKQVGNFHFRDPAFMQGWFEDYPDLLERSHELADRCDFSFDFGTLHFPGYDPPDGSSAGHFLRELVLRGARERYGDRLARVSHQVEEELAMIHEVGYEEYFLAVWDLLQDCRREGIDWITRGSAADSLVCYCLGISDVCPVRFDLYFRRFLNRERMLMNKLPDIDVDFPHDRKDDVIDLIFAKYGAEYTAVVGGFSTFKSRSAFAEIGKVLGVSEYQIRRVTERLPHTRAANLIEGAKQSLEFAELPFDEEPYKTAFETAAFLDGFPRYAKMHPCGVVISRVPMADLVPCFTSAKGYPTTHFDMDAVEDVGLIKIDILAQGGLAVMRDVVRSVEHRSVGAATGCRGDGAVPHDAEFTLLRPETIHGLPQNDRFDDEGVWELISSGRGRAVHHIESPAMISLARMLNVRDIDTLIAMVSVIRPGAANEQKKRNFALRHQGMQAVDYPHPRLEGCLKSTYGIIIYEEQILQICEDFCGFDAGKADRLRRSLVKQDWDTVLDIGKNFVLLAQQCGHTSEETEAVWEALCGFNGYAFCKAHSTAYGVEAYHSAWLKLNHPAEYMAAVLSNGKGFYHTLVYILECHRLGVPLLKPDVNHPGPAYHVRTMEHRSVPTATDPQPNAPTATGPQPGTAIQAPLSCIKGLSAATIDRIVTESARRPFKTLGDFYRRVGPGKEDTELLQRVGAFDAFGRTRTEQFWEIQWLSQTYDRDLEPGQGWLLPDPDTQRRPDTQLSEPDEQQKLNWEMELMNFTASAHPLALYGDIDWNHYLPIDQLGKHVKQVVTCCGLVVTQRTANQVTGELMKFMTIADYSGMIETELFAKGYKKYGLETVRYPVLEVTASVEPFDNGRGYTLRIHRVAKPKVL